MVSLIETFHLVATSAPPPGPAFDLVSMWRAMGLFARVVAAILAAMSVYSLGMMAERMVVLARARAASRKYLIELQELLPARRFADAVARAKSLPRAHLARVLGLGLEEYVRGLDLLQHRGVEDVGDYDLIAAVDRAIDRSSLRAVADLRRGLGGLATVGSTAPFVGLLGTVAGIITAFQSMALTGAGGLASVSQGIAEALVTTAFGLLVAIPAVMGFNYFTNCVEEMEVDMADAGNELVDALMKVDLDRSVARGA